MSGEVADSFWYVVKKPGALVTIGVALLLHLIAMGTPNWARSTHKAERQDTLGLWRQCTQTVGPGGSYKTRCTDFVDYRVSDWLHAAQSFMVLGFFGLLACVGLYTIYLFVGSFRDNLKILAVCVVAGLITGSFTAITIGVFAGSYEDFFLKRDTNFPEDSAELYWGFYLAVVAAFLTFLAPIMLLPETVLELRNEAREQRARIKAANYVKGQRRF